MSGSWVETQVPCMLYCGDDLCNCSARWFYEELEEGDYDYEEDRASLTQGKKAQQQNLAYLRYLKRLQDLNFNVRQEVGVVRSRAISMLLENEIVSALK